jgi:hypothetical protein
VFLEKRYLFCEILGKFECKKAPSKSAINKSEMTGTVVNRKNGVVSRKMRIRTGADIAHGQQALTHFSTNLLSRIISIQDSLKRCEIVSM